MKKGMLILLVCLILNGKTSAQGLITNLDINLPNMNFDGLVPLAAMVGMGLITLNNEVHIGFNYSSTKSKWLNPKWMNIDEKTRLMGGGYNIELRHIFKNKHRLIFGFQQNNYTHTTDSSLNGAISKSFGNGYLGWISNIEELKMGKWKPSLGATAIFGNEIDLALLVGSRFVLTDRLHLESRLTVGYHNLGLEIGTSFRYRKKPLGNKAKMERQKLFNK